MNNSSRDTAIWTDGSGSWMNLNRKRAPSGRKDFLEKNSRNSTGYALSEKVSSVSSDTERKEQSGLSGLLPKSHTNEGTSVHEMRKTGKDGRRILPGLQKRGSSFYRRKKYFSLWGNLASVTGTVQVLWMSGIRRLLRKSHKYLWKKISGTLETAADCACTTAFQKETDERVQPGGISCREGQPFYGNSVE